MAIKARYTEWEKPENIEILASWARKGLTQDQIAGNMGIGLTTLKEWRKKSPTIAAALKTNKDMADCVVENALFKKATGFVGEDGRYYPPDTTAMIFWLKNRQPQAWRDKREEVLTTDGEKEISGVIMIPQIKEVKPPTEGKTNE